MTDNVISAAQFERAAVASGRTMLELADLIGVSRTSIDTYKKQGVKRPRTVERVWQVMGLWLRDAEGNPFDRYGDEDLVRELSRRLAKLRSQIEQTARRGDSEPKITTEDDLVHGDGPGRYRGTGRGPSEDARSATSSSGDVDNEDDSDL